MCVCVGGGLAGGGMAVWVRFSLYLDRWRDVLPGVGGSWGGVAGRGGFDICSCIGFGRDCRTGHQPLRFPNILIFTFPSI